MNQFLQASNNLSDVPDKAAARANLGVPPPPDLSNVVTRGESRVVTDADYTIQASDFGKRIRFWGPGLHTLHIPFRTSFPLGGCVEVTTGYLDGVHFVADSPALYYSIAGEDVKLAGQYGVARLYLETTGVWTISGDIVPAV